MQISELPSQINVLQLAKQGVTLSGKLPLAEMLRLAPSLSDTNGEISIDLHFFVDAEGKRKVTGNIKAQLMLSCQRCLQPMQYVIEDDLHLGVIISDTQAKTLPPNYEPLLVVDDQQQLIAIVEDELIVRLPIAAMHDSNKCCYQAVTMEQCGNDEHSFATLSS